MAQRGRRAGVIEISRLIEEDSLAARIAPIARHPAGLVESLRSFARSSGAGQPSRERRIGSVEIAEASKGLAEDESTSHGTAAPASAHCSTACCAERGRRGQPPLRHGARGLVEVRRRRGLTGEAMVMGDGVEVLPQPVTGGGREPRRGPTVEASAVAQ